MICDKIKKIQKPNFIYKSFIIYIKIYFYIINYYYYYFNYLIIQIKIFILWYF